VADSQNRWERRPEMAGGTLTSEDVIRVFFDLQFLP
jgi:hypothetical protein